MAGLKIKKGDRVVVIAGRDKGKTGEVLRALPSANRVVVQGINLVKKNQKPSQAGPGGIQTIELPIHASNVALIDPKTSKPTRVGYKTVGDRKVRVARKSGEVLDR
jgi:large subunit ribosomal protein L24